MPTHDMQKQALREEVLRRRARLTDAEHCRISDDIFAHLLQDADFQRSRTVFTFCSMPGEISTDALIQHCFTTGKSVCVPRCGAAHSMTAHRIFSRRELSPGSFGIPEPSTGSPVIPAEKLDLVIVPCLCADRRGFRIGYGGGYYDRYLSRCASVTILLCAHQFLFRMVPAEEHDCRCSKIITEKEVIRTS